MVAWEAWSVGFLSVPTSSRTMPSLKGNSKRTIDWVQKLELGLCYDIISGGQRVVKIITKPYSAEDFALEVSLMREAGDGVCPNVITFYDYFEDNRYYYSVMEYCRGGDIFSHLAADTATTELTLATWIRQILCGIAHIHALGIVHRDIKPQNLLFSDEKHQTVKIIDFGLSFRMQKGELLDEPCGAPEFLSPEMVLGRYGRKVDVWSVGVLCYILLFGTRPFVSTTDADLFREIVETEPSYCARAGETTSYQPSDDAINFCKMLLQKNSRQRPTATEALKHAWLSEVSCTGLPSQPVTFLPGSADTPDAGGQVLDNVSLEKMSSRQQKCTQIPPAIRDLARLETVAINKREKERMDHLLQFRQKTGSGSDLCGASAAPTSTSKPGTNVEGALGNFRDSEVKTLPFGFRKNPLRTGSAYAQQEKTGGLSARRAEGRQRTRVNVDQYSVLHEEIDRLRATDGFFSVVYAPEEADQQPTPRTAEGSREAQCHENVPGPSLLKSTSRKQDATGEGFSSSFARSSQRNRLGTTGGRKKGRKVTWAATTEEQRHTVAAAAADNVAEHSRTKGSDSGKKDAKENSRSDGKADTQFNPYRNLGHSDTSSRQAKGCNGTGAPSSSSALAPNTVASSSATNVLSPRSSATALPSPRKTELPSKASLSSPSFPRPEKNQQTSGTPSPRRRQKDGGDTGQLLSSSPESGTSGGSCSLASTTTAPLPDGKKQLPLFPDGGRLLDNVESLNREGVIVFES